MSSSFEMPPGAERVCTTVGSQQHIEVLQPLCKRCCNIAPSAGILNSPMKRACLSCLLLTFATIVLSAQTPTEHGRFILHKFANANGEETYSIEHKGGTQTLKSDFLFTDRGTKVPLKATFTATETLEPLSLKLDGQSSRWSALKDSMVYHPKTRKMTLVREGRSEDVAAPEGTFLIDGYSPVTMQQMLVRFWLSHGRPAAIPTPPSGSVSIKPGPRCRGVSPGRRRRIRPGKRRACRR